MTLGKIFNFTERVHLKFEWQAFNVFNRANFLLATTGGGANNHVTFSNFGQAAGTLNPRQMQFSLKLSFYGQETSGNEGLFSIRNRPYFFEVVRESSGSFASRSWSYGVTLAHVCSSFSVPRTSAQQQTLGSIVGHMRVARGDAPPERILVTLEVRGAPMDSVYTDSSGTFGFHNLGPNPYYVVVNDDSYEARSP